MQTVVMKYGERHPCEVDDEEVHEEKEEAEENEEDEDE